MIMPHERKPKLVRREQAAVDTKNTRYPKDPKMPERVKYWKQWLGSKG